MPNNHHYQAGFSRTLFVVLIICFGNELRAQPRDSTPALTADPNLSLHEIPTPPIMRRIPFKHAQAADALRILQQLSNGQLDGIAVDERTNSLIVMEHQTNTSELEEACKFLDTEPAVNLPVKAPSPYGPKPVAGSPPQAQTFNFSIGFERGESIETFKQRYHDLEQQAHQLADKLKQSKSLSESDRIELQQAVRKSFEARQALQRAELADLAQRMQSMQQSIDMRDKLADKVIVRRVEDLLNPDLKWDLLAAKERLLDGPNSKSSNATATSAQSTPNVSSLTPGASASLPPSIPPTPISVPYDPGRRPEAIIMERIQGKWIAESMLSAGKDSLSDYSGPFGVWITGNEMRFKVGEQDLNGPIPMLLTGPRGSYRSLESADQPLPMDFIMDPNGEQVAMHGIIACDGSTLSICFADGDESKKNDFRPSSFVPGSKVIVIKCHRAPGNTAANKSDEADLSTPQATLDTIHRYSIDHPMGVPVECYTEPALQELSGVMLQQLCFMSGLSQIGLQTGGVIGVKDNAPIVAGTAPSFHLSVDALLKEHSLPTPPEECTKAFELLAKLTLGAAFNKDESLVKPDRELFRLAAGILKSPKEFLPKAGELSERFNNISGDTESPKKETKAQPKYLIEIDGDEATATQIVDSDNPSIPMSFKLQRINQRWLVSEAFSDEILNQMISSMSQVLGAMSTIESEVANQRDLSDSKKAPGAESTNNSAPMEWNDFLKLLPETGTALVMFSYEPDKREKMLPIAENVAEEAAVELIHLPFDIWRTLFIKEATHFVLMKDRQLIGTKTGLVTEAKLKEFVAQAKDWLTPQSTGVSESSLVRVDCYISPGNDNIGSQHGPAIPITLAVVAIDGDEALLFGTEGIAKYLEKGYACVASFRDENGSEKQVPLEGVLTGNVPLKKPDALNDDDALVITIPFFKYEKENIELQEAYDVGSAIYRIRGAHGLTTVKLAAFDSTPQKGEKVLAGEFNPSRHHGPIHGYQSPFHWQTQQNQSESDWPIYGANLHGAKMFQVLCPTMPAPSSFLFNARGRLIGTHGLGNLTEKDKTYTALMPYAIHSVLHAGLEAIDHAGLKAALKQTLQESTSANQSAKTSATAEPEYSGQPVDRTWLSTILGLVAAPPERASEFFSEVSFFGAGFGGDFFAAGGLFQLSGRTICFAASNLSRSVG